MINIELLAWNQTLVEDIVQNLVGYILPHPSAMFVGVEVAALRI